jgi:hypothetical protein
VSARRTPLLRPLWVAALLAGSAAAWAGPFSDATAGLDDADPAMVRAELDAAVQADPADADAWWRRGCVAWLAADLAAVEASWTALAALQPDHPGLAFWGPLLEQRLAVAAGPVQTAPHPDPTPSAPVALRIAAGGDTMLGNDLRGAGGLPPNDGVDLLAPLADVFGPADIAFVNLEGTLADDVPSSKCGPQSTSCYAFRSPTSFTRALTEAGIDVVSHANNHAMDLGEAGMEATAAALDAAGIAHTGRYGDVAFVTAGEQTVAFVGAHSGECCLNVNRVNEVVGAVAWADDRADLVVFTFHGGAEGSRARHVPGRVEVAWGEERGDVLALARAAVDAGADLVLGHGPHVLRAMEVYRGRLIAYSLGNLVGYRQFGTRGGYTATSALLTVDLAADGALLAGQLHPLALDDDATPHPDPEGAAWDQVNELSAADLPDTGVRVGPDGALSWGQEPR